MRKLTYKVISLLVIFVFTISLFGCEQESPKVWWDECKVTRGLIPELIPEEFTLTVDQEITLEEMIVNYPFIPATDEELDAMEKFYGGYVYHVEFQSNVTVHSWHFTPNAITHKVLENGEEVKVNKYLPDSSFVNELSKLLQPIG